MSKPVLITNHAREAMQLRRISKDEVFAAVNRPETTDKSASGEKRFFRGNVCVVTFESDRHFTIKTVLYRYGEQWTDQDVRARDFRK